MRVQKKTAGIQQMRQSETNAALAIKIGNTKEQLEKAQAALKMVEDELALLQESLDVVIDTDASKDAPILSSEHTLQRRLDRPASEMTYDEVTRKLHSQIVCLKQTKQWMSQAREAHVKEIEILLDCQHFLRNDITDKLNALRIDEDCLGLDNDKVEVPETERPTDLPFYPTASSTINISALGSPRYQTGNSNEWAGNGLVRPVTWATNTKVVVDQAKVTCATGVRLREKSIKLAEMGLGNEEAIHEDLMGSVVVRCLLNIHIFDRLAYNPHSLPLPARPPPSAYASLSGHRALCKESGLRSTRWKNPVMLCWRLLRRSDSSRRTSSSQSTTRRLPLWSCNSG